MAAAGLTVILLGLLVVYLGYAQWWFEKTHLLGSFGVEMLVYAVWHWFFHRRETRRADV